MIKSVKVFIVLLLSVISFISFSFIGKDTPTGGLTIGDKAPGFRICDREKQLVDLKDLRGSYVLISFWATYDADSRMKNAILSYAAEKNKNVELVSVSFDDYLSVFNETIQKDRIPASKCFVETEGAHSDIYKTYRLHKGFKNYLLDKSGIIIAKDINADQLSSFLKE